MILTRRDDAVLAVPDSAASTLAGVSSVYIVNDGKIKQQSVTPGVRRKRRARLPGHAREDRDMAIPCRHVPPQGGNYRTAIWIL